MVVSDDRSTVDADGDRRIERQLFQPQRVDRGADSRRAGEVLADGQTQVEFVDLMGDHREAVGADRDVRTPGRGDVVRRKGVALGAGRIETMCDAQPIGQ